MNERMAEVGGAASAASGPGESTTSLAPPRPAVLAAAVAILGVLVFAISIGGPWIYDDHGLIASNGWVHSFAHWKRWLVTDFWDLNEEMRRFGSRIVYWRPAITASYALDWKLGSGSPVVFHVTNLLWEGVVCWLSFRALHRWIGSAVPAFVAALVFALHPTKAESVAWIAGRTDVLCAAGLFVVSEAYAMRLASPSRARFAWSIALEALATAFAYTTKEQSIVLPAFVAVEAWVALGRPPIDLAVVKRMARPALPQLAIAIGYLALRTRFLPFRPRTGLPVAAWFGQIFETLGRYAKSLVWPTDLSVQQGLVHTDHGRVVVHHGYVAVGVVALVALVALATFARRRAPIVTVGVVLFLGLLLPTANVVPTGMITLISDRFLYLPILGLSLAIGGALARLRAPIQRTATMAVGLLALVLAVGSVARADDFSDEHEFWARELRLHPDSLEAIRFRMDVAARDRRLHEALALAAQAQQIASRHYAHAGYEADFIAYGVRFLALLTPDRDVPRLRAIASFCAQSSEPNATFAQLALADAQMSVPLGRGAVGARMALQRPRFEMLRADIESRLGDDEGALRIAASGGADCPKCVEIATAHAMIEARAGHYDRARDILDAIAREIGEPSIADTRAILRKAEMQAKQAEMAPEGPLRLNLRATELATLEVWGRAYAVLAPYTLLIKRAPGMAYGFAELAFRAGHPDVATDVLGALVPPEKIEPTERRWARRMGWIDEGPLDIEPSSSASP